MHNTDKDYEQKYMKYKSKYLGLKNEYLEGGVREDGSNNNFTDSQSTTIGLFRKGRDNYRTILTDSGLSVSFKEVSIGDIPTDKIIRNVMKRNRKKVLVIETIHQFDIFTNKYGSVRMNGLFSKVPFETPIYINWDRVSMDYKGFYLNPTNELRMERYSHALLGAARLKSWWQYEYNYSDVIIFNKLY
jgi:hypothetical protein